MRAAAQMGLRGAFVSAKQAPFLSPTSCRAIQATPASTTQPACKLALLVPCTILRLPIAKTASDESKGPMGGVACGTRLGDCHQSHGPEQPLEG